MKDKHRRIKHFGINEKGIILFFLGKFKYHHYYDSILETLAKRGYLVISIPYRLVNLKEKLKETFEYLKVESHNVILMSHAHGDETVYWFHRNTSLTIDRIIISAPTRNVIHYKTTPTLILWADKFRPNQALDIFTFVKNRKNYRFIGYPNCTRYLFAGVGYSRFHDIYDKRPIKVFFDADKYYHIDEDIIDDICLFIDENKVKEKIAIFSENYLPFNSGVNILTNVLKTELEKEGKRVYPVTLRLKGVDYETLTQEKNVVAIKAGKVPGKKAATEAIYVSWRFYHNLKLVRAYQFDYIQLQTEFTIGIVGMLLRKRDNIPLVYTAHTMWNDMIEKRYKKPISSIINFAFNKLLIPPLKVADLMTVPTLKVKQYYMQKWNKKEPIVVIPGCVDGSRFILKEEDNVNLEKMRESFQLNDKIVIGYIGRVSKEKSIDQVVDYYESLAGEITNLVLMIVGNGPYSEEIFNRTRNSKYAERIIFVGGVPNDTLKYYYRLFDAFCTASTFETQGLTYVESMWCHTPILAREDSCLDHFLTNGVNGITFTDYESWKNGLYRIINDKEYVKKLTDEAYKTALTYDKDIWAKKMYYLYTQAKLFNEGKITEVNYDEFKSIGKGE